MASEEEIALKLVLETDKANLTLGELEDGFDAMAAKLKKVGRGSEEFKTLSTAMAATSAELQDLEAGFEGLGTEAVAGQMGGLAGGIGDVTASLVLMGGENETIEQMAASIETALAISMGFKGVIEGTQAGMKLYNSTIKNSTLFQKLNNAVTVIAATVMKLFKGSVDATSKSFKTLKTAIAATGIGLLVVGVAALVANFGKIKDAINGVSTASKELQESTSLNVETNEKNLESIDNQTNSLKLQGLTERDILNMKLEAQKKVVDSLILELEANKVINKEKVAGAERNQKILIKTAEFLFIIPRTLLQIFDFLGNSITSVINEVTQSEVGKKLFGLEPITMEMGLSKATDDLLDKTTKMLFDPEATEIEGQKEQEVLEANLRKQINALDGHKISIKALDEKSKEGSSKSADDKKLADEKAVADALALEAEKIRLLEDLEAKAIEDKNVRALAELENSQVREREALRLKHGENAALEAALDAAQKLEMDALEDSIEQEAKDKKAERLATEHKLLFDAKLANEESEEERQKLQLEEDFQNKLATLAEQGLLTKELKTELLYTEEQALAAIEDEFREKKRQADIETAQITMDLASTTLSAISDVSNAYADRDLQAEEKRFNNLRATKQLTEKQLAKEELKSAKIKDKIRKRQFENDKKMQIAMAAINGAQALTSIFAQYPKFDGGFAMTAALATAVITTAATIAKIKSTSFSSTPMPALPTLSGGDSPDGAGSGGGGAQITPVSNTSTIIGDQQVYVTETDITSTQNQVNVIEESATF